MIKQLLFCGALICSLVGQAAPQSRVGKLFGARKQRTEMHAAPSATVTKWLPGQVDAYYMGSENWVVNNDDTRKYTYDERGNVLTSVNYTQKIVYEYNSDDMPVSEKAYALLKDGKELLYLEKKFKYDSVVKDCRVLTETSEYIGDSDPVTKIDRIDVSRDKAGNVTSLEQYRFDSSASGLKEPVMMAKVTFGYGADGKVNELKAYSRPDFAGDLEQDLWLKDIVWENTNGQIVTDEVEEFDFGFLLKGDNRFKAATFWIPSLPTMTMDCKIQYTGSDYEAEMIYRDIVVTSGTHKNTDSYGSFEEHYTDVELGTNESGDLVEDGKSENTFIVTYDCFGLQLREYEYEKEDNGDEWYQEYRGTVTYDPTHGYPVEYVMAVRGDYYGEEYVDQSRKVFSNYTSVEVDGIEAVGADEENAPVEYFDLQGKRVANPSAGLYIRRQGSRATKVIL